MVEHSLRTLIAVAVLVQLATGATILAALAIIILNGFGAISAPV